MDDNNEVSYLFDKKVDCYVCERSFTTKQVRTGKVRYIGTDDILKPLYSGIDCTKYDVIMCPHCGYAATPRTYGHMTAKQRKDIKDNIGSKFYVTWKEEETYSYDVAIRRCKMALLTEMIMCGKPGESAYICLRLAWLYEGRIDRMRQLGIPEDKIAVQQKCLDDYIADAYMGFKEAVATQYPPICGMDEMTINYLLASLAYKCGDETECRRFGSSILSSRSASSKIKEKTRNLMDLVKKS
ncbi:MAG: DUF2225 domain-containing protein [Lachnospira sp.]